MAEAIFYPLVPGGYKEEGQPPGRWEDRVREYVSERGVKGNGLGQARRECMDRERWRSVCHGHPLEDASEGSRASELQIDRLAH